MNKDIRFIYFDLGGVFFRWRESLYRLAEIHGKSREDMMKAYGKFDAAMCRGLLDSKQLWERLTEELGIVHDPDFDFSGYSIENFIPIPEMHAFVTEVADTFRIGLLTNIHNGYYNLYIRHGMIPSLRYQAVIQSCEIGVIKPEKKIFELAQKKAGYAAKHILFVDDFQENIDAALDVGWNVLLFDTDKPDRSIEKIRQMLFGRK